MESSANVAFKSTDFKGHFDIFVKIFKMKHIRTIEELKQLAKSNEQKNGAEIFIALNAFARSSKQVVYHPSTKTFDIYNEIDDSFQEDLSEEDLSTETLIVEAIKKNALFLYEF